MLEYSFIICFVCVSIHSLTREGAICELWRYIVEDNTKEIRTELFNPVTECLFCMSTFWTCIFMSPQVDSKTNLLFLGLFFTLVILSIMSGEKDSERFKFSYLFIVFCFLLQTESFFYSFSLMLCVNGLNYIVAQFLSFIQLYKEKELDYFE